MSYAPHRYACWLAVTLLALVGAAAAGTGCTAIAITGTADGGDSSLNETDADTSNEDGGTFGSGNDSASTKSPYSGSPLCHATSNTCWPDLPSPTVLGDDAGAAASDASLAPASKPCGDSDAGADGGSTTDGAYPAVACRVRTSDMSMSTPACGASGQGQDGASCKSGADCSPGLDCTGAGVCRKYCCAGECSGKMNGSNNFFCDIVSLTEETTLIPACVPVKACTLLDPMGCTDPKESCSIVKDDGTTSCVATGSAGQGDSCDEAHCAANLVCLGQPGVRQCFQLCKMQESTCPMGLTCKANALSHDPSVGICQ